MDLIGRDFLTLLDFTPAEIGSLLDLAAELKAKKKAGIPHDTLRGKNVALIFEKTSTRTRCSFEVAAHDLGMGTTYLDPTGSQIGKKESIADTAQVLSGMFEGIEYRGYGQAIVEELARYASVPVWNGLTNEYHPTQILADFLTLREHFGKLQGLKFAYMGDARYNMGNSLMIGCAKMGLDFVACAPKAYWPDPALVEKCKEFAERSGASITLSEDTNAVAGADVIYTDVWVSMGEPVEVWAERIEALSPYQVNAELMAKAKPRAVFMHCLPAYHDHKTAVGKEMGEKFNRDAMEVTDEVFNGPQSIVFQEAENRMHTIKAVMAATLGALVLYVQMAPLEGSRLQQNPPHQTVRGIFEVQYEGWLCGEITPRYNRTAGTSSRRGCARCPSERGSAARSRCSKQRGCRRHRSSGCPRPRAASRSEESCQQRGNPQ